MATNNFELEETQDINELTKEQEQEFTNGKGDDE